MPNTLFDLNGIIPMFDSIYATFSKTCKVYYEPTIIACNCSDSIDLGPQPAWISGSQISQFNPSCPMCGGGGKISQENSEDIKLILEFNPSKFDSVWKSQLTRLPKGLMQAKGVIADLPKITRCIYLKNDLQEYVEVKWTLSESPVSPGKIIQSRYFTSVWEAS